MAVIGQFLRTSVDLVFPPACMLCGRAAQALGARLCPACNGSVTRERKEPACPRCGESVGPYEVSEGSCRICRRRTSRLDGTVRVGTYGPELGRLIRLYKFSGRDEIEPVLGGWLAARINSAAWFDRLDGLVAVPTHWMHRIRRPLHAADALAAYVSRKTGLSNRKVLKRTRAGRHQVGLPYSKRVENVRGAFALRRGASVKGTRLLLVDDVRTSGATLDECAKVLRKAGAAEVYAAIVAKVPFASEPTGAPIMV